MNSFFSMEGGFYKVLSLLADVVILSVVWIALSAFTLGILTGILTTAMYYTVTKRIANRETYLMRDFWSSFKQNFVQATCSWLLIALAGFILIFAAVNGELLGNARYFFMPFQFLGLLELLFVTVYIFPVIARFKVGFKEAFKNAFFLSNKHLPTSVLCLFIAASCAILVYGTGFFAFFAAGSYVLLTSYLFIRIFRTYRSDFDSDAGAPDERAHTAAPRDQVWQKLSDSKDPEDHGDAGGGQ